MGYGLLLQIYPSNFVLQGSHMIVMITWLWCSRIRNVASVYVLLWSECLWAVLTLHRDICIKKYI